MLSCGRGIPGSGSRKRHRHETAGDERPVVLRQQTARLEECQLVARREGAVQGFVQGPPYHCDIAGMRALFPSSNWHWPKPENQDIPS